jgi:hypothetical protein
MSTVDAGEMVDDGRDGGRDATVLVVLSIAAVVNLNQAQRRMQTLACVLICGESSATFHPCAPFCARVSCLCSLWPLVPSACGIQTFLEDATLMVTAFPMQVSTIAMVVRAGYLPIPEAEAWAVVVLSREPSSSSRHPVYGAVAVLLERRELAGCIALIVWCFVHPEILGSEAPAQLPGESASDRLWGLKLVSEQLREISTRLPSVSYRCQTLKIHLDAELSGEPLR